MNQSVYKVYTICQRIIALIRDRNHIYGLLNVELVWGLVRLKFRFNMATGRAKTAPAWVWCVPRGIPGRPVPQAGMPALNSGTQLEYLVEYS